MSLNKKVTVKSNAQGAVVIPSENNPDYAYVRLEQERTVFDGGWVRQKLFSAIIAGETESLQAIGFFAGQELEGKIVAKESLTPFNEKDPERDYKMAGDTGIVCCKDGEPIYRKTFYVEDDSETDELISHTNGDAIKEKLAESTVAENAEAEEEEVSLD